MIVQALTDAFREIAGFIFPFALTVVLFFGFRALFYDKKVGSSKN